MIFNSIINNELYHCKIACLSLNYILPVAKKIHDINGYDDSICVRYYYIYVCWYDIYVHICV